MPEVKDKRLVPREQVHLVTEIDLEGQQTGCGVSHDASGAGLLLLTHLHPEPGSELTLRLYIPGEAEARRLSASVVRCEPIPAAEAIVWTYRVAVSFRNPPSDLQQLVRALTKRPSSGPPTVSR
ncbi:MAG TPA: PilZ domain-containing protein [Polyangiaceae bacterium]|nr:PilZ domain-containing protein [Polyangiaceae bacterium]